MLGFFVGFLIGGVVFIVGLIGAAEILQRMLAPDWARIAEDIEQPIRVVNNKEARHE